MTIKRNDPCPCGSGLKYKRCCLAKDNVIDLNKVKEQRYFELRYILTRKMLSFLDEQLSFAESQHVTNELRKFGEGLDRQLVERLVEVWRCYFYRYPNGLRGVDWFVSEARSLSTEEMEMLQTWTNMPARLIQAIDRHDTGYTFQDMMTDEQFYLPKYDNVLEIPPWSIVLTLMEPYNDGYIFHGITSFHAPTVRDPMIEEVQRLIEASNITYPAVMSAHFLQLHQHLHQIDDDHISLDFRQPQTVEAITLHYKVIDEVSFFHDLLTDPESTIDEWEKEHKQLSWTNAWYRYTDSLCEGAVYVGKVIGNIEINKDKLTFMSFDPDNIDQFKKWMANKAEWITFVKTEREEIRIPYNLKVHTYCVRINRLTPPYFPHFAQLHLNYLDLENPVPLLGDRTPIELIQSGHGDQVEQWLRGHEYVTYHAIKSQNDDAQHTYDMNFVRRKLGLPLSPFVSDQGRRESDIYPCPNPTERPTIFSEEDIPVFEELGFYPDTVHNFYARDLFQFFKEKTDGKSRSTYHKYRDGIEELVYFLGYVEEEEPLPPPLTWFDCDFVFWFEFFESYLDGVDFDEDAPYFNKVRSVMRAFGKWLDSRYGTEIEMIIKKF